MVLPDFADVALVAFLALLLTAAVLDLRSRIIPNWLALAVLAVAIARWSFPFEPAALMMALGLGLLALVGGFILFSMKWIGGGDAKLIAAVVTWFGPQDVGAFLLLMCIAGALLAAVQVVTRRFVERPDGGKAATLPYAVAIALGAVAMTPLQAL